MPSVGSLGRRPGRPSTRTIAGGALIATIAIVIGVVESVGSPASTHAATRSQSTGFGTVQRRNIVQTDTQSGTLSYANPHTVYNRIGGTVTWLPAVGRLVSPGQTLYKVDNSPVILFDGTTPAFRTLSSGVSNGPDVLELNANLVKLGFNPSGIVVNDTWQAATTAGVDQWQGSLGETETGKITFGKVVFLPGLQRITTIDATLGATGSGTSASSTTAASLTVAAPTAEFVSLESSSTSTSTTTTPTTTTGTPGTTGTTTTPTKTKPGGSGAGSTPSNGKGSTSAQTLAALIALLKAESAQLKASRSTTAAGAGTKSGAGSATSSSTARSSTASSSASSGSGSGGSTGSNATAILGTTSTQLVVTVDLPASSQSEAVVGAPVSVQMPGGNTVAGRISAVSPVAVTSSSSSSSSSGGGASSGGGGGSSSSSGSATVPVTITLKGKQNGAGLDQAAVSVNFAQARANHVLSVPVTALLAVAGGNYAVQEAAAPHKLIPVSTGLFAAGYVQISGAGIYPGLQVTDSQG